MSRKILVVEDEHPVAEMIKFGLEHAGYKVVLAVNGEEGLFLISQHHPDLIISDILMPVMDGFTFYKELKKNAATSHIPVLILTARGKMEDSFKVIGVDDFIVKPFDVDVLLAKIENFLQKVPQAVNTNKNILVVGSVAAVVEKIVSQMKKKGCLVESTTDGSQVLSKAMKFKPDLILIEVTMPQAPPEEIVRAVRCLSQFNRTSILIYSYLTAKDIGNNFTYLKLSSINDSRINCLNAGANEYIGHYSEPLFLETIEKYLNKL